MEKITSKNNLLIKKISKLSTSSAYRKKCGEFLVEGVRLCFDIINSNVVLDTLLYTDFCREKNEEKVMLLSQKARQVFVIDDEISNKLADTKTPQGIFCLCKMKENTGEIDFKKKYVALEMIQDPSNLGAIVRTAEAFGIDGVILGGCVDIYNPKAMRAAMGSLFRFNVIICDDFLVTLAQCKAKGMKIYTTVTECESEKITEVDFSSPSIAVIGNEGNGASDEAKNIADKKITIPMSGVTESLNAATAASITMWEMMRGNGDV